ncbi:putative aminoacyltransferase, E1 ubiquitin-activating enzyme [Medicago truncatula]|uniref:E3 ubiquitin-protein ligase RMA n=1 Tax=Medicago truncatula TaxID=3880 RepID=A0A072VI89_MEDTR|nr:E3 ubiquitin-protein ligase RMA2-like [Medicago truncatula]KEH41744.1 zinc finger, C3HC4 type (RING finger) protein [Medicago truncatula]RHN79303.1 putative aminoacyltransferase, E1 ubiquitin-activating enzyme [Medicago truncatula]
MDIDLEPIVNDSFRQSGRRSNLSESGPVPMDIYRKTSEKKENVDEKDCGNDRGFYDCNICFDLAKEPVLTCCGHLFCWPCLYRWLNTKSPLSFRRSSLAKECPVCKGEVTDKTVTPIYGGGNEVEVVRAEDSSSTTLQIPPRPNASVFRVSRVLRIQVLPLCKSLPGLMQGVFRVSRVLRIQVQHYLLFPIFVIQ